MHHERKIVAKKRCPAMKRQCSDGILVSFCVNTA